MAQTKQSTAAALKQARLATTKALFHASNAAYKTSQTFAEELDQTALDALWDEMMIYGDRHIPERHSTVTALNYVNIRRQLDSMDWTVEGDALCKIHR